MTYTPVELRHVRVGRSLFGYNRAMVEQVIEEVAHSFEATWRERGELAEKVEALEKQLEEHRQREGLLTQTLLAAEQAAGDVRERARREAEAIVLEAHSEARAIGRKAHAERERLLADSQRIEAMLRSALGIVSGGVAEAAQETPLVDEPVADTAPVEPDQEPVAEKTLPPPTQEDMPGWAREDTHEFDPIGDADDPRGDSEPESAPNGSSEDDSSSGPVLERISGTGAADFDWGE
jgi:hypothetical protein